LRLRIATRGSPLARWQAEHVAGLVADQLAPGALEVEFVVVRTQGDQQVGVPIWQLGGKGVFVNEVRAAVLGGAADVAVHSAKDLPARSVDGLVLAAVPRRGDPRDVLVGSALGDLAPGALVATGSARRRCQLANLRPDLRFVGLRGNIATRLDRVGTDGIAAVVAAAAALERLGLSGRAAEVLDPGVLLPQVGQGALAVECASGAPAELAGVLASLEDPPSRVAVDAERGFLDELGGDCDLPAGAFAEVRPDGVIGLRAMLASLDGHVMLRHGAEGTDPVALGRGVARHLLDDAGGSALLGSLGGG
jgi:hydroxymethylbilane synthase